MKYRKQPTFIKLGEFYTSSKKLIRVHIYSHRLGGVFTDETLFVITSDDYIRYGNRTQTLSILKTYVVPREEREAFDYIYRQLSDTTLYHHLTTTR